MSGNHSTSTIWWFDVQIIYAENFTPNDIGVDNIRGEGLGTNVSYLHIESFAPNNVGTYKCSFGEDTFTYKLNITGTLNHFIKKINKTSSNFFNKVICLQSYFLLRSYEYIYTFVI